MMAVKEVMGCSHGPLPRAYRWNGRKMMADMGLAAAVVVGVVVVRLVVLVFGFQRMAVRALLLYFRLSTSIIPLPLPQVVVLLLLLHPIPFPKSPTSLPGRNYFGGWRLEINIIITLMYNYDSLPICPASGKGSNEQQ